ncbi:MerR family transcriptional regulator [Streptomyces griseus]|uniref:helix-turn-helix domain-containing protein n=1 Tax=Streptomyces griseus TaxID=1911 RepID=UPI0007C6578F|nr:MerR family transcriptional regulator [Streptomyces griseus]
MTWSTRQVAELAGTTLKTVRHYHKLGLLEEPERAANGYKRYGVKHLVRLMGIRRLVDLGVQLADVPSVQAADGRAEQILRTLDGELARNIERQQRMRREIAAVLDDGVSLGLPPEFGAAASDLPQPQQALLVAYSSILTPRAMSVVREQFAAPRDDSATEFEQLTEDATGWRVCWRPRPAASRRRTPSSRTWTRPPAATGRSPDPSSRRPSPSSPTRPSSTSCAGCTLSSPRRSTTRGRSGRSEWCGTGGPGETGPTGKGASDESGPTGARSRPAAASGSDPPPDRTATAHRAA